MSKNLLVVLGHPKPGSLCDHLADVYAENARKAGHSVEVLKLGEMNFDPVFRYSYREMDQQPFEPELERSQKLISESSHLVFIYPSWWASMPGLLKGWIDRVFLPGFAFKYQEKSPLPAKLLRGKSARLILTMDAPSFWFKFANGSPGVKLLKNGTLQFCGVKPVKVTILDKIRGSKPERLQKLIEKVANLGRKGG